MLPKMCKLSAMLLQIYKTNLHIPEMFRLRIKEISTKQNVKLTMFNLNSATQTYNWCGVQLQKNDKNHNTFPLR